VRHAHAPLPEERARNHAVAAKLKKRKDRHEVWKAAEITKHVWNDTRAKRRRAGMSMFLLTRTMSRRLVTQKRAMTMRMLSLGGASGGRSVDG
jgi:hypothetical protein